MKRISVIVPFHMGTHYLKDCLDSLLAQTHKALDVVVVRQVEDDSVTDVISEYVERGLPVRDTLACDTKGVASARNVGLSLAQGEYVYFLDSDDYLLDDALETLLRRAQDEGADAVFGTWKSTWFKRDSFLNQYEDADLPAADAAAYPLSKLLSLRMSALNVLMRRDFIKVHSLRMDEAFTFYSDEVFLTELLSKNPKTALEPRHVYVKRKHNDPVTLPSLSQLADENKAKEYAAAYLACKAHSQTVPWLDDAVDYLLCRYALSLFSPSAHIRFPSLNDATKEMYLDAFGNMVLNPSWAFGRIERQIVKYLCKKKPKKASRLATLHYLKRKKKGLFGNKIQWFRTIDSLLFRKLPIKEDWILFESFLGKNYDDSCRYLYEYLVDHSPQRYRFIWVLPNKKRITKGRPTVVKRDGLRYLYYTSRCKYWVNNMRQPIWWDKREGMVFIQTWHGTPLKRLVFDMDDVHSAKPTYKKDFYHQSRMWDYLLSDNPFSTEVFARSFLFPKDKILEYGYPRNDLLHAPNRDDVAKKVRQSLGIPEGVTTVLYAPTWRDDDYYAPGQYRFTLALDLAYLRRELGDSYVILLRTHYFIADKLDLSGMEGFVKNVSNYDGVAELYLASDICITDYSSVFFDYANLKRPILFYVYDFDKYKDVLRGFYINMENDLPGPLLYDNEEVADAIKNIDEVADEYRARYEDFHQTYCSLDDGKAAQRVVKKIFG